MPRFTPRQSFIPLRRLLDGSGADPFALRVARNEAAPRGGEFVLYWMQSVRRVENNLALQFALDQANRMKLPLVIYESLRPDYPSANDRIHTFVLQGVAERRAAAERQGLRYLFFLPRTPAEARGVLRRVARRAAIVVTDEFPTFIVREQTERFFSKRDVPVALVDGNGLLPMRACPKEQYSAKFFREKAHRLLPDLLTMPPRLQPSARPFRGDFDVEEYDGSAVTAATASCEVDHSVRPVSMNGSRTTAMRALEQFVTARLAGYAERSSREAERSSELSPYLHFGILGIHEILERVLASEAPDEDVDAFLEQAVIRRELSFNLCFFRRDHDSLSALPEWAMKTLDAHRKDRRKPLYSSEELERGETHDEVWNLSQRALLELGTMHNYLRMLWGKKILEWSGTPEEAHRTMLHLHEKYALDGRDPNTHAGVLWCFGKHDRPWAPERPIFGTIRYMSSESTRRKLDLRAYAAKIERERVS